MAKHILLQHPGLALIAHLLSYQWCSSSSMRACETSETACQGQGHQQRSSERKWLRWALVYHGFRTISTRVGWSVGTLTPVYDCWTPPARLPHSDSLSQSPVCALKHLDIRPDIRVWFLGCPGQGPELVLLILLGPFKFSIICDSVIQ